MSFTKPLLFIVQNVTIITLSIIKIIPMYAKVLHSELDSVELALTSLI